MAFILGHTKCTHLYTSAVVLQYSFYVVVAVLFYIYFSLFPSLLNRMMVYSLKAWMGALDCVEKRTKGMI